MAPSEVKFFELMDDCDKYYEDFIVPEMNGFEVKKDLGGSGDSVTVKASPRYEGSDNFFSLTQAQVNELVNNGITFIDCRPYRFFPGRKPWTKKDKLIEDAPSDYRGLHIQCNYTWLRNEPNPLKNLTIYSSSMRLNDTRFLEEWENVNINTYCFAPGDKFLSEIMSSHSWPLSYGISLDTPEGDNITSKGVDIKTNYMEVYNSDALKDVNITEIPKNCDNLCEYIFGINFHKEVKFEGSVGNFAPEKQECLVLIHRFRLDYDWINERFTEISSEGNDPGDLVLGVFKGKFWEVDVVFDYT